jgi:hypothetical protein
MNNTLFHTSYHLLNLLTILVLTLPVMTLLLRKKCWKPHFLPIASIFLLFLASSLLNNGMPDLGEHTAGLASTASFLFLSPLALYFLLFFLNNPERPDFKKAVKISLFFYLLTGLSLFFWRGLDETSGMLTTGLGFLLVLLFSVPIFLRQIRTSIHKRTDTGMAFMITSIVFAFSCYTLIFLMQFVAGPGKRQEELFLLFQLITIFFALLMTTGIALFKPSVPVREPDTKSKRIPMLTEWEEYSGK